jgi:hypothetical protein
MPITQSQVDALNTTTLASAEDVDNWESGDSRQSLPSMVQCQLRRKGSLGRRHSGGYSAEQIGLSLLLEQHRVTCLVYLSQS